MLGIGATDLQAGSTILYSIHTRIGRHNSLLVLVNTVKKTLGWWGREKVMRREKCGGKREERSGGRETGSGWGMDWMGPNPGTTGTVRKKGG